MNDMILLNIRNCKSNNINFTKMLEIYDEGKSNYIITCPGCGSNNLIGHGHYERYVILQDNNCINKIKIKIKRVKCKNCNTTHALLPIPVIPYKQTLFPLIINSLYDEEYFNSTIFSYDVREKWKKQYNVFLPYIKTMLQNKKNIYEIIKENFNYFYEEFYYKTKRIIFLLRKSKFNVGFL